MDWHRLDFRDLDEVDRFLRVNEFDPGRENDLERLEVLRDEAVEFLRRTFGFRIPDEVAEGAPVRELFLLASKKNKRQMYACIVLKTMHIIHHLAGRELLFRLPISDDEVFHLVERKVVRIVEEIRAAGHQIAEFEWSRKPRDSLIVKLLAKKSTLAANIYDKLRFRLVVREEKDLFPLIVELEHRLIPFNYVVPGESVNDILSFRKIVEESPDLARLAPQLMQDIGFEQREDEAAAALAKPTEPDPPEPGPVPTKLNEFSGPGYRIINFVADMPIRIDDYVCRIPDPANLEYGAIVFVLTEFQIVDTNTAKQNELGENSHDKYKERQHASVKQRLLRGFVSEKQKDDPTGPIKLGNDDK